MARMFFDPDEDLEARIAEIVRREGGIPRSRAIGVLLELGLETLDARPAQSKRFHRPKPEPTIEERLERNDRLRAMLLGLADAGGRSGVGELGRFGNVGVASRYKWSRVLMNEGLIVLWNNRARLTDAGWEHVRRLREHEEGRAA